MTEHGDRARWLHGAEGCCVRTDSLPPRPTHFILLGAPGVGKGTQAEMLADHYRACHLSTGDVFRAAKSASADTLTEAMRAAMDDMGKGRLVSDDTVVQMVEERGHCLHCPYGFLLDGFPRTVMQAEALEKLLEERDRQIDAVVNYVVPMETVIARLSGRRTCTQCKTTYHLEAKPPRVENVCDKCGGELYQREDDRPESIKVRLQAYEDSTAPLTDYYEKKGILINVPAEGGPLEIFERSTEMIDQRLGLTV